MKRIGLVGGTFDPIHAGHLFLGDRAAEALSLDEVWYLPAGDPYFKTERGVSPAKTRLEMVRLALEGQKDRRVCDLEVRRGGRTYTCETLEELRRLRPDCAFTFLVGGDCLSELSRWKDPGRILAAARVAVLSREGRDLARLQKEAKALSRRFGGEVTVIPAPAIELSSTMLRERVKAGLSLRGLTPEKVERYILENGLYR
ncbi:MAG: nicotinate-nucleotide adenylyltransferase [Clostridia bacterium]|nr:nicotinate-nucleotide adenylyltransferase [Clostridia bacterium]